VLRHAQEQLRENEAAKQAAILNALPAHIALLDTHGIIISVNEVWRQFGRVNANQGPGYEVGVNYLEICDSVRGDDAAEARQAAAGIRSVLSGAAKSFSIEYPSPSPTEQRWFLMTVNPLAADHLHGAVVMHLDITAKRQSEESLQASELRFRQMADNIRDVFFLLDAKGDRMYYASLAYEEMWGRTRESLYANAESWTEAIHPDDQASTYEKYRQGLSTGSAELEFRLARPDGSIRWIEIRGFPVRDDAGKLVRIAGVAKDVTERKRTQEEIKFKNTILQTLQEVSLDAILVVGEKGQIISYNQQFIDLWHLSPQIVSARRDVPVLQSVADQVENSEAFVARIKYLYEHRDEMSREEVQAKDGRTIDRYSAPIAGADGKYYGRVWHFRDITERKRLEHEREQYFKFFMLSINPMCIADPYGCFKRVNPAFIQLLGYSEGELISNPFVDFIFPEDRQRTVDEMKLQVETRATLRFENRYVRKDGKVIHLSWMGYFDSHDGVTYATANDVTQRKEAEARIVYLNRVYATLSGINTLIVHVHGRDELFSEACRVAVETGGFRMAWVGVLDLQVMKIVPVASAGLSEEFLTGLTERYAVSELGSPEIPLTTLALMKKSMVVTNDLENSPTVVNRKRLVEAGIGSMAILPLVVSNEAVGVLTLYAGENEFFREEEVKLLTELAGDIAFAMEHIGRRERLEFMAYHDELTGLANRNLFLDRVTQYMRSAVSGGHKLAVFLIDLERFRSINDSLGRAAGDALLRQVAEWLTRNAGGDANLLARVGSDHFAAVLPEIRQEGDLARFIEKSMEDLLDSPFRLNDAVFGIAAKVGVAVFPDDGADAETLLRNAEAALKKAKASGEHYLFYTQTMTAAVAGKLTLENQLRHALDNGEFVLHYQPKVNLASGKLTSAEALIRWNDPRTGLVPPGRFIPILEETGLIYEVGRWALRQAIADYLRWRAAGLPAVRIAVNVSALQLRRREFITEVEQAIGIDPHASAGLELEITESLIMEDVKHNIASLEAIRAMGISIAIDDFGTGFSSLSYLARLPVDTLKIDRSFVIDMTAGPEGLALVSTIINLAHSLKLKVVAEGVETEEQSRLLRLLDCDEVQGYLFSKPLPGEIFEARYLNLPGTTDA
jgi:diguanylate cyclase (GGDEF)-like protein/PAS domain S-box-containing protein